MSDKEINITYETLFEFAQREKSREELQNLGNTFYEDVLHYIQEKVKILQEDKGTLDNFSEEEKEKTRSQLDNIKRILTQLYERREKKIINMAIHKSREPATLVDESVMLEHESEMYAQFTNLLDKYRKEKLVSLLSAKPTEQPSVEKTQEPTLSQEQELETQENTFAQEEEKPTEQPESIEKDPEEAQSSEEEKPVQKSQESQKTQEPTQTESNSEQTEQKKEPETTEEPQEAQEKETKRIKFIHYVPKFLGREMEVYGPFEPEDIATIPTELANILIEKGRAERI